MVLWRNAPHWIDIPEVRITTVVLLALATFVAYMRWRVAPIQPRRVT